MLKLAIRKLKNYAEVTKEILAREISGYETNQFLDEINHPDRYRKKNGNPRRGFTVWFSGQDGQAGLTFAASEGREVPMNKELRKLLLELQAKSGSGKYILPRLPHWRSGNAAQILRMFCEGNGLKSIRFHTLRACFATQLLSVEKVRILDQIKLHCLNPKAN